MRWWLLLALLAGCARAHAPAPLPLRKLDVQESFEPAPEFGGQLYVLQAGPRDGPPLVLIHGLGAQGARDFEPLLPTLSKHYRVLAFDLPGLARSGRRNDVYSPQRYTRLVSALVARHFTGPVAVLGHSMGGALALQLAADHPEQVSRLLVLDVAGVLHWREYMREVIAGSRKTAWQRALAGTRKLLWTIGMLPARRMQLQDLALEVSPTLRGFFSSSRTAALLFIQHDFGPAIRRVRAPTFVGWGALDTVAPPRTAALLRSQLPVAQFSLFDQSGHTPMRDEPEAVADAVVRFLDAPSADVPVERPGRVGRDGSCERSRDLLFEGDYDTLTIHRCKGVVLRHVRAQSIVIDRSEVELEDVNLESLNIAATIRRSRVRWTGGKLRAEVCAETDGSVLDLAGVRCAYRSESIRVHRPSRFVASASVLSGSRDITLHGEYELFRTTPGVLDELRPKKGGRWQENGRPLAERGAGESLEVP
jgi:pimeloyl-ACP methyl ester carboxylesterase